MIELSRKARLARDTAQAASCGYVLLRMGVDRLGQRVESWGRDGLTSTMERSEQDGWLLCLRDEHGDSLGAPVPIGVSADQGADVLWALVEQDKPRFYTWRAVPMTPSEFAATCTSTRTEARTYRVEEYWFMTVSSFDGSTERVALPDSWTAAEALVHADLALYRRRSGRAHSEVAELQHA